MTGLASGRAKADLILVDLRLAFQKIMKAWDIDCNEDEAENLMRHGQLVKLLIRNEYQKLKETDKGMAIQANLMIRYGVSESLVIKIIRGER